MKLTVYNAIDAKQTPEWKEYLEKIGWNVENVGSTYVFIHKLPLVNRSLIKIQHPVGPLPLSEIEKISKQYRTLFTIIEPHNEGYDEKTLKKHGYKPSFLRLAHTATIKIDLDRSEQDLFNSFSENAKRNIKKAQKNNLLIKTVWFKDDTDLTYFNEFYRLLMHLSKMKKFYSPSRDEYLHKMKAFGKTSVMLFAYEKDNETPIAVVWMASHKTIIHYMQTGIVERGYELLANYLLVWEGLKLAQQLKMKIFDFETMYDLRYPKENKDWIGYTEFKKRFHGEIIEYPPVWMKVYNPIFKVIFSVVGLFH